MNKEHEELQKAVNVVGGIIEQLEELHGRNGVLDEARCLLSRLQRAAGDGADPVLVACYLAGLLTHLLSWDQQRVETVRRIYGRDITPLDIN